MSQTHKFKEFLISSACVQKQNTQQLGLGQVPHLKLFLENLVDTGAEKDIKQILHKPKGTVS